METMTIVLIVLYMLNIFFNEIGDDLNDEGTKTWGHLFRALAYGCLLIIPYFMKVTLPDILGYIFLRFSSFDIIYNLSGKVKLPITYTGTSSFYGRIMTKLNIGLFVRFIFLAVGLSVIVRY